MKFAIRPFQKLVCTLVSTLFGAFLLNGQSLTVTDATTAPYSPTNLISNVFLGTGVEVSNIQFGGNAQSVGYFSGGQSALGIDRGIILTTGLAATVGTDFGADDVGFNFASSDNGSSAFDANLAALTSRPTHNVAVYTITFRPTSDTLRFRYCFASEEYPEFGCSNYNDLFGFFIQGPGYPTPTNIAKIPGTNLPVSINNIHPINPSNIFCTPAYTQYYNDNSLSAEQPVYDGFTDVFTAMAVVQPCQQYTIKLAIADVQDKIYDSGVFLEAKSFSSGSLQAEILTASNDGTVTEGCSDGTLKFVLPSANTSAAPINLDYNVWGTATNSVDYQAIPSTLSIAPGQKEVAIPIVAFADGIAETGEFIAIDIRSNPCQRDTFYIYLRDNTLPPLDLGPDTSICVAGAVTLDLDGTLPIPVQQPKTFSNAQDFNISPVGKAILSPITVMGIQPAVLGPGSIKSVCLNIQHPYDADLDIYLISPDGIPLELSTDNGGTGNNYYATCFKPTAVKKITAGAPPFAGDFQPEGVWSDLWGSGTAKINGTWKLQITDDQTNDVGALLDWDITFEPAYKVDYQWFPASTVVCDTCSKTTNTSNQATTYHLRATDSYGCATEDSVRIEIGQTLAAPAVTCADSGPSAMFFNWTNVPQSLGLEINVNGAGWQPAPANNQFSLTSLAPGTAATVEVRGIGGQNLACPPLVGAATCETCSTPVVQAAAQSVSCFGLADGSVALMPDGKNPPYQFQLGAQSNATGQFSGLAAGTYTATITDADGCQLLENVAVMSPDKLAVALALASPISCNGVANGAISANASGGTPPLSFIWSNGQTVATASNLSVGNYTVIVSDSNGCTTSAAASLSEPPALLLAVSSENLKCFGQTSGTASANASGGAGGFAYLWSSGQTAPSIGGLAAGNFTVTVTDANGCSKTATTSVSQPPALAAAVVAVPVKCFGGNDGAASVNASGGTGSHSYQWSNGQNTPAIGSLTAGIFTVTITDSNSCTNAQTVEVVQPPLMQVAILKTDARCFGAANGTATVSASGGAGNYNFKWSNGQTSATASGLAAGNFTVTVTDANGCTATLNAIVGEPAVLNISAQVTDVQCFGQSNGRISLAAQGGTAPHIFKWSTGETTPTISGKPAGDYLLTVTDANGCTAVFSQKIGQPAEILLQASASPVKCFGEKTGWASLNLTGGTPSYAVGWSGPDGFWANGVSQQNLAAGIYTATVADAAGCQKIEQIFIEQPAAPLRSAFPAVADTVCFGATDGQIRAIPTGGTAPYFYQWSVAGQSEQVISGLLVGEYFLTITDANGCKSMDSTSVIQQPQIFALAESSLPLCHDGHDATARVRQIFYAVTPAELSQFAYLWSTVPPQSGQQAVHLQAEKTYTVTATDNRGCTATQTVSIGNVPAVSAQIVGQQDVRCAGDANGWAAVAGTGGAGNFTYLWSANAPMQTDSLAKNLTAGAYTVTVTDAHGCPAKLSVSIGSPAPLRVDFAAEAVKCFGENSGAALAQPSGGTPEHRILWENGTSEHRISSLAAGVWSLTLTDAHGCQLIDSVEVKQPGSPISAACLAKNSTCFGSHDGQIQITAAGGNAPYRYSIDGANWVGSSKLIGLRAGMYAPWVMDKNGCTLPLPEIEVAQMSRLAVELGPDVSILLGESAQLFAEITNAAGPLEIAWNAADAQWLTCLDCADPFVDSLLHTRQFEVLVVDTFGCTADDQITVHVEKPRRVSVPTGFTPNGDWENDVLLVHGQKGVKIKDFRVFDRWGELLWQAENFGINDSATGWDGTFRGKPVDPGVFVWVLEVEYMDGLREVLKGSTTLLR